MLTVLHGENIVAARSALVNLISQAKQAQAEVVRLDGKKISKAELEATVGGNTLFATPRLIIIEELHSLTSPKLRGELLNLLIQLDQPDTNLVLWEKRSLTATMLKPLVAVHSQVQEFKTSNAVFTWLDSLSSSPTTKTKQLTLLHQALDQEDAFFCLIMLARQIRLLIQAKDGGKIAGPPFMLAKLRKQAEAFSLEKLLNLHAKLLALDLKYKTSSPPLSLAAELDILTLEL